jgi:hypothetical protein
VFQSCPLPRGCVGGVGVTNSSIAGPASGCEVGYEGILCAVCSRDFYLSATTFECKSCGNSAGSSQLAVLVAVPTLLLALASVAFTLSRQMGHGSFGLFTRAPADHAAHNGQQPHREMDHFVSRGLYDAFTRLGSKVKVVVTSWQIVASFPGTLDLIFPSSSTQIFRAISFINLSALNVGSPECYTRFDYVSRLLVVTVTPIVLVALLGLVWALHRVYLRRRRKQHTSVAAFYVSLFLVRLF